MAHRWTEDDDLLVIDVYLRHGLLRGDATEVRTLARLIGKDVTVDSVVMALANVHHLATGQGLSNPSQHMTAMWERWGHRSEDAKAAAVEVRRRREAQAWGERPVLSPDAAAAMEARVAARMAERRRARGR